MTLPAIVPFKALSRAKSRLASTLGEEAAAQLSTAMLLDVIDALGQVAGLDPVAVVTPDPQIAAEVQATGARALLRNDPGLNASVDGAAAELATKPGAGVLVVLGDVAAMRPEEIAELIAKAPERGVALAPSSDGGTSALLRRPHDVIPAGFGPGSAATHRDLAARAGVPFREIALPSLAIDVDERDDLDELARSDAAGPRTRAWLLAARGGAAT